MLPEHRGELTEAGKGELSDLGGYDLVTFTQKGERKEGEADLIKPTQKGELPDRGSFHPKRGTPLWLLVIVNCNTVIIVSFWEWEKNPRLQAKTSVGLRYYGILS